MEQRAKLSDTFTQVVRTHECFSERVSHNKFVLIKQKKKASLSRLKGRSQHHHQFSVIPCRLCQDASVMDRMWMRLFPRVPHSLPLSLSLVLLLMRLLLLWLFFLSPALLGTAAAAGLKRCCSLSLSLFLTISLSLSLSSLLQHFPRPRNSIAEL